MLSGLEVCVWGGGGGGRSQCRVSNSHKFYKKCLCRMSLYFKKSHVVTLSLCLFRDYYHYHYVVIREMAINWLQSQYSAACKHMRKAMQHIKDGAAFSCSQCLGIFPKSPLMGIQGQNKGSFRTWYRPSLAPECGWSNANSIPCTESSVIVIMTLSCSV